MSALQHLCSDPKIIQSAVCTGTDHNLVDGNRFLDFIDGLCVFRKMRECDRRTQCRKVNCVFLIINSIRIRFMDHSVVIITNSQICASTVQNAALRTMRPYKFTLGVTYGTTRAQLEKLMADLQAMLDNSPYTNKGTNIVRLTSFGDSSINILISAYLTTNVYATFLQQQNDLNLNIMDVMQADGVDFAFPSTSVYIEKN